MTRRNLKKMPVEPVRADVESLTQDARGVAHIGGKAVFIEGALPGEEVMFTYVARHRRYDEGQAVQILKASPHRVEPRCPHFNVCGGCSLQHMAVEAQILAKQQVLLDSLAHIGKVAPESLLPPLTGLHWGYRRKARLSAKYVMKKPAMLVGFCEKRSNLLADLTRCDVLDPSVGERIVELRALLNGMDARDRIPQIEIAVGDHQAALVFRTLADLDGDDQNRLRGFGERHGFQIYLQPGGPETAKLLWPESATLSYRLPDYDLELFFLPTDFTQVNAELNRPMINRALELLDPQPGERILDLFCGLGNFTLPLARRAGSVVGVEGSEALVQRARDNAQRNGIANVEFHAADLNLTVDYSWVGPGFDKILLDPPRTGAFEAVKHLPAFGASRLVYVSCNPATLARDAAELVHNHGYRMVSAGVMDMFPHTTHVESIALFER
ncbi:MAG: 23S rRNA (uracil(1939)-C(5))-methyltransferase RlmD [Gammaproteobacteria bacterium]